MHGVWRVSSLAVPPGTEAKEYGHPICGRIVFQLKVFPSPRPDGLVAKDFA